MDTDDERRKLNIVSSARALLAENELWQDFYAKFLGRDGILDRMDHSDRHAFLLTSGYRTIVICLKRLYERQTPPKDRMVMTVRLPKAMHSWLVIRAAESNTSLNLCCVVKLLGHQEEGIPYEASTND